MSGRIAAVAGVTVIPAGCGGGRLRAAALGVQGLAPYFFEVEATAYVGEGSRDAAHWLWAVGPGSGTATAL